MSSRAGAARRDATQSGSTLSAEIQAENELFGEGAGEDSQGDAGADHAPHRGDRADHGADLAAQESRMAALLEEAIAEPEGLVRQRPRPASAVIRPRRRQRGRAAGNQGSTSPLSIANDEVGVRTRPAHGGAPAGRSAAAGGHSRAGLRPMSAQATGAGIRAVRARHQGPEASRSRLDASPMRSPPRGAAAAAVPGAGLVDSRRISTTAGSGTGDRRRPATAGMRRARADSAVSLAPSHHPRATSAQYLKMAAERQRKREAAFAAALLDEEMQLARQCAAWASEATEWAQRLGLKRSYRQAVGGDGMVVVVQQGEDGAPAKEMKPREFRREREKLHAMLERQRYRPRSAVQRRGGAAPAAGGAEGGGGRGDEEDRAPRQPRAQVQEELQALLRDTTALTERLHSQLAELSKRGWNAL